jgi:hypothetical protein
MDKTFSTLNLEILFIINTNETGFVQLAALESKTSHWSKENKPFYQ